LIDELFGLKSRVAGALCGGELLLDLPKMVVVAVFGCPFLQPLVLRCLALGSRLWQVAGHVALRESFFRASFDL
jgi:hypothetical protein